MTELKANRPLDTITETLRSVADNRSLFFTKLCELSNTNENADLAVALTLLQHQNRIQLGSLISSLTHDDHDVWTLARLLVCGLAETDISPQEFLESIQNIASSHKHLLPLYNFDEAVSIYCAKSETNSRIFIDACLKIPKDEDRNMLLTSALIGLSRGHPCVGHTKCLDLSRDKDRVAGKAALFSLAVFDYKDKSDLLQSTEQHFVDILHDAPPLEKASLASATSRLLQSVSSTVLSDLFLQLNQDSVPEVRAAVLRELWFSYRAHHDKAWHQQGVSIVLDRPMATPNELEDFDHLLRQMLETQPERALEWLERWAFIQPTTVEVKVLRCTADQLRLNHKTLSRCITRWFNSNCRTLHLLAAFLVRCHTENNHDTHIPPLLLDVQELSIMQMGDVRFLLGKIYGYCFQFQEALVSLVFSVIQKPDFQEEIDNMVISFFVSNIALNYPGTTQDHLKNVDGKRARKVAHEIQRKISEYFDPLKKLPVIKECQPSEINHQKMLSVQHTRDTQMMKEVEEESILKHIANTFMVKKGRAFLTKLDHEAMTGLKSRFGTPTPFIHHSITTEIPRCIMIDPVKIDWKLRCFRAEIRTGGTQ